MDIDVNIEEPEASQEAKLGTLKKLDLPKLVFKRHPTVS